MSLLVTQGLGSSGLMLSTLTLTPGVYSLAVQFSSAVILTGDAADFANWVIAPTAGARAVSVLSLEVDDDTVTLTTTEHGDNGEYELTFPSGIFDDDEGAPFAGPFTQEYTGVGTPPTIMNAYSIDARTMDVVFSETVREDDATTITNYAIVGPSTVLVTKAEKVTDVVYRLTTTPMERTESYDVEVENIRDLALNPMDSN